MWGQDEPQTLRYAITINCSIGVDSGQTSYRPTVRDLLKRLSAAESLGSSADCGYDANWFRNALMYIGILPCIPSRNNRRIPSAHDTDPYKKRQKIENTFAVSKIGDGLPPAMTDAPTSFSLPAHLPPS